MKDLRQSNSSSFLGKHASYIPRPIIAFTKCSKSVNRQKCELQYNNRVEKVTQLLQEKHCFLPWEQWTLAHNTSVWLSDTLTYCEHSPTSLYSSRKKKRKLYKLCSLMVNEYLFLHINMTNSLQANMGTPRKVQSNILLLWVWSKALNRLLATELTASWYTWFIFLKYKLIKEVTEMKSIS